jgi:hypothetical protein
MPQQPRSARRHYLWSAGLVKRGVREANAARPRGSQAVSGVVAAHQATAAFQAQPAVAQMLAEQAIDEAAQALLNSQAFTTATETFMAMVDEVSTDYEFDRLVASLIQDAGRAAESVATTVRPRIGFVRYLNPPSCARCAVLAGRIYRWSTGFDRHELCDCTMIPTTLANPAFVHDPVDLMREGLISGLSKADQKAINDGADFGQVVNVRLRKAGLHKAGRVLSRRGRLTPEGIYTLASSRDDAIERLIAAGYVR